MMDLWDGIHGFDEILAHCFSSFSGAFQKFDGAALLSLWEMKKLYPFLLFALLFMACSSTSNRVKPKPPPPYLCIKNEPTRTWVAGGIGLAILGSAWYAPDVFVVTLLTTIVGSVVMIATDYDYSWERKTCDWIG